MIKDGTKKHSYCEIKMVKENSQYSLVARTDGKSVPQEKIEKLRKVNMEDDSKSLKWSYGYI